jgi:hypothetical protein
VKQRHLKRIFSRQQIHLGELGVLAVNPQVGQKAKPARRGAVDQAVSFAYRQEYFAVPARLSQFVDQYRACEPKTLPAALQAFPKRSHQNGNFQAYNPKNTNDPIEHVKRPIIRRDRSASGKSAIHQPITTTSHEINQY